MKSRGSLMVLVILVVGFMALSFHLAGDNRDLENEARTFRENSLPGLSSSNRGGRTLRPETVGDLLGRNAVPTDARGMLKSLAGIQQGLRLIPLLRIQRYLDELTLEELRSLRRELRETPGIKWNRELLERMISKSELRLEPDDLGGYFFQGA